MTPEDIADVLSVAAACDLRTVGTADILVWYQIIGHLAVDDARQAVVTHYAKTRERIMPADVLRLVHDARADRADRTCVHIPVPDANPDDVHAYRHALQERARTAGDRPLRQRPIQALIAAHSASTRLPVDPRDAAAAQARRAAAQTRLRALSVPCPWEACLALAGHPCTTAQGRRIASVHPARATALAEAARRDESHPGSPT